MEREGALAESLEALLREQLGEWEDLARGHRALAEAVHWSHVLDGWELEVQLNLGRAREKWTWVGPERPGSCFLCAEQRPREQRALRVGRFDFLCNPAPLFPEHCTVVWPEHGRRRVAGHLEEFCDLAWALGSSHSLLFNGPRAGASAPNHLHAQVFTAGRLPLERELMGREPSARGRLASWTGENLEVHLIDALGRGVIHVRGRAPGSVAGVLRRALTALEGDGGEPDVNLLARSRGGWFHGCLLPRKAHRPACFFAEEAQRLCVSPGAADMAGLLILTRRQDVDRLTPKRIVEIYGEVAWGGPACASRLCLAALAEGGS